MKNKEFKRPSTSNWWIQEESGLVKKVSVRDFLKENDGYTSEYTQLYNVISSAGCVLKKGIWFTPDGRRFENVYETFDYLKMMRKV